MSMMPPREIQHRLEAYSPKCLERLSGKSRRAPNRGHRGQHRGARRPYFRVAGERSSLVDTSPTHFPDSLSSSTLAIWPRITSHRRSIEALGSFCGSLQQTNPQKVALQRTCSCWKVHSQKGGLRGHKPYLRWSVGGRHLDHRYFGIGVRGISIPFAHKWLKSS